MNSDVRGAPEGLGNNQAVNADRLDSIEAKLEALLARTISGPLPQFLTIEGAAAYSGLSEKSVRRLISRGDLQPLRPVRGRVLVQRQALDALILSSTGRMRKGRGMK